MIVHHLSSVVRSDGGATEQLSAVSDTRVLTHAHTVMYATIWIDDWVTEFKCFVDGSKMMIFHAC